MTTRDVLGSLRFLLETDGFDVRTFRSGAALLNGIAPGSVDCFVIDYKMPAMSGIDLASRLRNRYIDTPIILITGYPDGSIRKRPRPPASPRPAEAPSRGKPREHGSGARFRNATSTMSRGADLR